MKFFVLSLFVTAIAIAQQPQWHHGVGSAAGTDVETIRTKALQHARTDALSKAGISVTVMDARLLSESGAELTDFYSKFAQSYAKGIILDERIVREGELRKIKGTTYEIEIELDALIGVQRGDPDPGFTVDLESSAAAVKEGDSFTLLATSSKSGYLTIFDICQDSISVVFPNAIDRDNRIEAAKPFRFPPHNAYELQLTLPPGKTSSSELFLAVVTTANIPFPDVDRTQIDRGSIGVRGRVLSAYSRWLFDIPPAVRSAAQTIVTVQPSHARR